MEVLYQLSYPGGFGSLEPKIREWHRAGLNAMGHRWDTELRIGSSTSVELLPMHSASLRPILA